MATLEQLARQTGGKIKGNRVEYQVRGNGTKSTRYAYAGDEPNLTPTVYQKSNQRSRTRSQNETINSLSLTPSSRINLPQAPETQDYSSTIFGNQAGLASILSPYGYNLGENGQLVQPPPQPETPTLGQISTPNAGTSNGLKNLITTLGLMPKKESIYSDPEYQREQRRVEKSRRELNNYTANLNSIVTKSQAEGLALEGQGRGITESIIGGQQAQIAREAAIQALPVQAQVAAAQGNLDMAERNLDQVYRIKSEAISNEYEYKINQYNAIKDFLTKEEERRLAQLDLAETRTYNESQKNVTAQDEWAKFALANGRPDLISSIHALDPKSPTFQASLGRIQAKLGATSGDRLLTPDEAQKYGRPYGTKLSDLIGTVPGGGNANPDVAKGNALDYQAVESAYTTIKGIIGDPDKFTEKDAAKLSNTDAESLGKALALIQNPASTRLGTDAGNALNPSSLLGKGFALIRKNNPLSRGYGKSYLPSEIVGAVKTANALYKQRAGGFQGGYVVTSPDGRDTIIITD